MIVFAPRNKQHLFRNCTLNLDGCTVSDSTCVKNLSVHLDQPLNMDKHISALAKSCFAQIRAIGRIRPYLTVNACKILVCSLITLRLDYGNALLFGINRTLLAKLQRVQNTASRLITLTRKHDHISLLYLKSFTSYPWNSEFNTNLCCTF